MTFRKQENKKRQKNKNIKKENRIIGQ